MINQDIKHWEQVYKKVGNPLPPSDLAMLWSFAIQIGFFDLQESAVTVYAAIVTEATKESEKWAAYCKNEQSVNDAQHQHNLKTWPEYFQSIVDGTKTFEIRKNDRGFKPGDILILQEWIPETKSYTGRVEIRRVGVMIQGEWGLPDDICVMSLLQIDDYVA